MEKIDTLPRQNSSFSRKSKPRNVNNLLDSETSSTGYNNFSDLSVENLTHNLPTRRLKKKTFKATPAIKGKPLKIKPLIKI